MDIIGYRKLLLGVFYLFFSFLIGWYGLKTNQPMGAASIIVSMATGVGFVVWGNVQTSGKNELAERPKE